MIICNLDSPGATERIVSMCLTCIRVTSPSPVWQPHSLLFLSSPGNFDLNLLLLWYFLSWILFCVGRLFQCSNISMSIVKIQFSQENNNTFLSFSCSSENFFCGLYEHIHFLRQSQEKSSHLWAPHMDCLHQSAHKWRSYLEMLTHGPRSESLPLLQVRRREDHSPLHFCLTASLLSHQSSVPI